MTGPSIDLWFADLAQLADPLTALEARDPLAPAAELEALDGPRRIARMTLRRLLARTFGRDFARTPFSAGPHGKPILDGLPGDFNVSHTIGPVAPGGCALIGIGHATAIGVDLEAARTVRLDERRRTMIIAAAIALGDGADLPGSDEDRVLHAWARLEAWGKADGRGIGRTLVKLGIWGRPREQSSLEASTPSPLSNEPIRVHDVAVGPALFAAVAMAPSYTPPPVRFLPKGAAALAAVLSAPDDAAIPALTLPPGRGTRGQIGA
jgi:phosphopantetheinyl transferase